MFILCLLGGLAIVWGWNFFYTMMDKRKVEGEKVCVNGQVAFFDVNKSFYLVSLSQEDFDKDSLRLKIHCQDYDTTLIVTPSLNMGVRPVTIVKQKDTLHVDFTCLPIVSLYYEDLGYVDYTPGEMCVRTDGSFFKTQCLQRYRGSTSKWRNLEKKSYGIKLVDEHGKRNVSLLGMRKDNSWILDPMPCDYSRMRNLVSFEVWKDMDNRYKGIDGKFVEVFVNHEYMGIYCLTEKVDRKQLGLKKAKGKDLRGALFKCRSNQYPSSFFIQDMTDDSLKAWIQKYPKEDENEIDSWIPLKTTMDFLNTSSTDEFRERVDSMLDVPMMIDNYLFVELLNAFDNIGCNKFVYYQDYKKSPQMKMMPWDMDRTWTDMGKEESEWYRERMAKNLVYARLKRDYPQFGEKLIERWNVLRKGVFGEMELQSRFETYCNLLKMTGATRREEAIWRREAYVDYVPKQSGKDMLLFREPHKQKKYTLVGGQVFSIEKEVEYIKNYIHVRIEELDEKYRKGV